MKKIVFILLTIVPLSSCHCPAQDAAPIPQPTSIGDIVTNAPQTESFTNATVEIDTGALVLGIGQTTEALAFVRGSYNWNLHCYTGLELQLGAGNVIDGVVLYPLGVRKAFDDYEFFGGIGPKYDFDARAVTVALAGGGRWNVFKTTLNATPGTVWANISVGAEVRSEVGFHATARPSLGFNGFINYKF